MIALGIDATADGACAVQGDAPPIRGRDLRQVWQAGLERFGALAGAVLTAPAGGAPGERRSLLRLARQADIDVFRLISAPAAAALAHAGRTGAHGTFAVLDLRRTAFDCSLVSVDADRVEVLAAVGFADLGADAVDQAIVDALAAESHATPRDLSTLRLHARQAREALADAFDTGLQVRLPSGARLDRRLTRHEAAHYADRVRRRWMAACRRAVAEAESHPAWLDGVLVLDNAPMLRRVVRRAFNQPAVIMGPDARAEGAARYARILVGEEAGPLVLERSTHGLCLEARDGTRTPILPAGVPLPASVLCQPQRGDRLVHLDWRGKSVAVEALEATTTSLFLDADGVVSARP
ncbi:MAG: Hsp70 family protein [Myxococcales bacterium]|nr:Hsp70 family protein [Myxococcales bacterium]